MSNFHSNYEYIPGNPHVFGPGTWWILHLFAYRVDRKDKILQFIKDLHYIAANIPCLKCRHHASEYLHDNDGSKYVNKEYKGRHIGMFKWMSDFHNTVNGRKGYPIVDWKYAFDEYDRENERWMNEQSNGLSAVLDDSGKMLPKSMKVIKNNSHLNVLKKIGHISDKTAEEELEELEEKKKEIEERIKSVKKKLNKNENIRKKWMSNNRFAMIKR